MPQFDNISKNYGNVQVIKNVSGIIKKGECTAIIGPSGSGKSTLIRLLSLLEHPNLGNYTLDDSIKVSFPQNKKIDSNLLWPKITVVFQQLFLWPHLTLIDNIHTAIKKNQQNSNTREDIENLLDFFELSNLRKRYPNQLSIGQRQRVALIRALALKPDYLLLDEITASLDVEHIKKVKEVLQVKKSDGMGILFATHLLGFASSLADNIWFMDKGEFVETGNTEILSKPKTDRFKEFLSLIEN